MLRPEFLVFTVQALLQINFRPLPKTSWPLHIVVQRCPNGVILIHFGLSLEVLFTPRLLFKICQYLVDKTKQRTTC